jgi:serine/threonine protein kinase
MLTTDQVLGKGRYRIISNFSQDESSSLYEAYDTVSNAKVVLRETVGSNGGLMTPAQLDEINSAFVGEAKTLSEARHESLLSVQDYFSDIDRQYLVMESVDGCDLAKFLGPDEKAPALGDVVKWADQILAALDYLHTLDTPLIHRDIRPVNIRLTSNFKVKVLTAGITRSDIIMAAAENPADSTVLNYRPLEQLWGGLDAASQKVISNSYDDRSRRILMQPLDARSDIYSVGATLYHLVTRVLPNDALERSIEMLDGNSDPLVAPSDLDPAIPEALSEVIMKAMELHREHRYDSAAIMRQVLNSVWQRSQAQRSAEAKPRVTPEPLPVVEPTATVVDLKKAEANQAAPPPVHETSPEEIAVKEAARAEERRREMEADLERQRQEAERIKTAEVQTRSKSPAIEEDVLLEVEPVRPVDEAFEWSVEVSEQPSREPSNTKASADSHEELDFNIGAGSSSNMKFIAAAAGGLIVVVAILGWVFMGGSTPAEPPKAQIPAVQQQDTRQAQETAPVSAYTDQSTEQSNTVQGSADIQSMATESNTAPTETRPAGKKPTPTPGKTAPKKKVTVDDLINDN